MHKLQRLYAHSCRGYMLSCRDYILKYMQVTVIIRLTQPIFNLGLGLAWQNLSQLVRISPRNLTDTAVFPFSHILLIFNLFLNWAYFISEVFKLKMYLVSIDHQLHHTINIALICYWPNGSGLVNYRKSVGHSHAPIILTINRGKYK